MNRELILSNITEAREQLEAIERSILKEEYEEIKLRLDIEHAYHHLNFAWNIWNESKKVLAVHDKNDFIKWSKYPKNDINEYE